MCGGHQRRASPYIAVLVGEYSEEKFAFAVRNAGLRHNDIITWREREECHHFSGNRVIRHVQRFLFLACETNGFH